MTQNRGVSRRGFVRGVAGTAAAPAALAGMATANAAPADVSVAATVVRASHSKVDPHALRLGVRASVRGPNETMEGVVLVVEPVRFGASAAETRALIAESVQTQIAAMLVKRGVQARADHVAVQVFGGVL